MLAERLSKRMRHLVKWAGKRQIGCFRLYERDIPEFPIVIDWYADLDAGDLSRDGDAIAWFHDRTKDDTLDETLAYRRGAEAEMLAGLGIPRDRLFMKYRGRQRDADGGREQYERVDSRGVVKLVAEHGSRFEINLTDYVDAFGAHEISHRSVPEDFRNRKIHRCWRLAEGWQPKKRP